MPNQYMQGNEQHMGHMGQGMMGNHMMNNMGPHGAPMMGPNNMPAPHHMGPGMQGPGGHMMGSMGHQNYSGNYGNMMQGGPNMMGNNMGPHGGPQGGMMGPGMQGPNGPMMSGPMGGPGGPPQGNMMHNNMPQHGMMSSMNNMNMPPNNSMMSHNMMQPGGHMGNQQGMMPPHGQMNHNQMMRGSSGPGPNGMPMMPPSSMGSTPNMPNNMPSSMPNNMPSSMPNNMPSSMPNNMPSSMPNNMPMRMNDSVSCQDPFADEPYQKSNSQQMPYSMQQPSSGSNSPMPPNSIPSSGTMASSVGPVQGGGGQPHMAMSSSGGPIMSSSMSSHNSYNPPSSGAMSMAPSGQNQMPPHQSPMHPSNDFPNSQQQQQHPQHHQQQQPQMQQQQPPQSDQMKPDGYQNNTEMPRSNAMSHASNMPHQNQPMNTSAPPSNSSTPTPSMKNDGQSRSEPQPHMFNQDSNSSSSMPDYPGRQGDASSVGYNMAPHNSHSMDNMSSSQFSNTTNTVTSSGRQFPFGDNQFSKPDRYLILMQLNSLIVLVVQNVQFIFICKCKAVQHLFCLRFMYFFASPGSTRARQTWPNLGPHPCHRRRWWTSPQWACSKVTWGQVWAQVHRSPWTSRGRWEVSPDIWVSRWDQCHSKALWGPMVQWGRRDIWVLAQCLHKDPWVSKAQCLHKDRWDQAPWIRFRWRVRARWVLVQWTSPPCKAALLWTTSSSRTAWTSSPTWTRVGTGAKALLTSMVDLRVTMAAIPPMATFRHGHPWWRMISTQPILAAKPVSTGPSPCRVACTARLTSVTQTTGMTTCPQVGTVWRVLMIGFCRSPFLFSCFAGVCQNVIWFL